MAGDGSFAGNYLLGHHARKAGKYDEASAFFENSVKIAGENEGEYNDQHLLYYTYSAALLAGEHQKAAEMARMHVKASAMQEEGFFPSLAYIIALTDAVARDDDEYILTLQKRLAKGQPGMSAELRTLVQAISNWSYLKTGKNENIIKDVRKNKAHKKISLILLQYAIALDLSGDEKGAHQAFKQLERQSLPPFMQQVVIAYEDTEHSQRRDAYKLRETSLEATYALITDIATLMQRKGDIDDAVRYLRLAQMLDVHADKTDILLGNSFSVAGDYAMAAKYFGKVAQAGGEYQYIAARSKALALSTTGDEGQSEALFALKELYRQDESRADILLYIGDILSSRKSYKKALPYYDKWLAGADESDTGIAQVLFARGICHERVDNWDDAEADFLKSLDKNPDNPEVLNYLAYSWIERGENIKKAEEMLHAAVQSRPSSAHIIDSYGWVLYHMAEYEKAVQMLERANLMIPYDAVVNDHLGDAYLKTGRKREAVYQWQRALRDEEDANRKRKIRAKLNEALR